MAELIPFGGQVICNCMVKWDAISHPAATVVYYRPNSAVREVCRALGLDLQFVEKLSKSLAWWGRREELLGRFEEQGFGTDSYIGRLFFELMPQLLGFPRHLSQHVGGFIITASPI